LERQEANATDRTRIGVQTIKLLAKQEIMVGKIGQKIFQKKFAQLHKHVTSAQLHMTNPPSTNHREENKFTTVNSKQVEEVN
jgi:hypothetical protein